VRALEAELSQFTEDDTIPQDTEDIVRPGGLVRLDEDDETPRFLGPSSGIAMTRLVMEEAKEDTGARSRGPPAPSAYAGARSSYEPQEVVPYDQRSSSSDTAESIGNRQTCGGFCPKGLVLSLPSFPRSLRRSRKTRAATYCAIC
jgi:hypothetical protein